MDDVTLVQQAVDGDRDAFAALYDRYSPQVFGLSCRMLRDRHEAADVTGDVFLIAAQRLGQLRDPAKVRAWLLAVTRNEVHRVLRHRRRVTPEEDVHMLTTSTDELLPVDDAAADPEKALAVVTDAAEGLDERDRTVLELSLAGVGGDELGAALGVSTPHAYQLSHRMKERLERSIGALYVARVGRSDCQELGRILEKWDGHLTARWRKHVGRHIDSCEVCERHRKLAPAAALSGTALAAGEPISALGAPPPEVRELVLNGYADRLTSAPRPWGTGGWPPALDEGRNRRRAAAVLAAAAALLLAVGGLVAFGGSDPDEVVAAEPEGRPTTTLPTTAPPPETTVTTPVTIDTVPPAPTPTVEGSTTVAPSPTTAPSPLPGPTPAPGPSPSPTPTPTPSPSPSPSPTPSPSPSPSPAPAPGPSPSPSPQPPVILPPAPPPPADKTGPSVGLTAPSFLVFKSCMIATNPSFTLVASDPSGVVAAELLWKTNGAETSLPMSYVGNNTWRVRLDPTGSGPVTAKARARDAAGNVSETPASAVPTGCPLL